jgi:hypothetical protein
MSMNRTIPHYEVYLNATTPNWANPIIASSSLSAFAIYLHSIDQGSSSHALCCQEATTDIIPMTNPKCLC